MVHSLNNLIQETVTNEFNAINIIESLIQINIIILVWTERT